MKQTIIITDVRLDKDKVIKVIKCNYHINGLTKKDFISIYGRYYDSGSIRIVTSLGDIVNIVDKTYLTIYNNRVKRDNLGDLPTF